MADKEIKKYDFTFNEHSVRKFQERFSIEIWCDGREYDPTTEAYHPRYAYKITANEGEWGYIDNDISGPANAIPDLKAGAKSLFAFLIACQEGLPEDIEGKCEHADLFPPNVREFAYNLKEAIETEYQQLQEEGY